MNIKNSKIDTLDKICIIPCVYKIMLNDSIDKNIMEMEPKAAESLTNSFR